MKLDYLKDHLMVIVDCSNIDEIAREDLFMNSRDRPRSTHLWKDLEHAIQDALAKNTTLRELNHERRRQIVEEGAENSEVLKDALEDLLRGDPDVAKLLLQGTSLKAPFPRKQASRSGGTAMFVGKQFPTYFRFADKGADDLKMRDAEIGRTLRVKFQTDATDDYLGRTKDAGEFRYEIVYGNPSAFKTTSLDLNAGTAAWSAELADEIAPDDEIRVVFTVDDDTQIEAFTNELLLMVRPKSETSSGSSARTPHSNAGSGGNQPLTNLNIPEVIPVREGDDNWVDLDFDANTALRVRHHSGQNSDSLAFDFFYNIDNTSLKRAQSKDPTASAALREQFRCSLVVVGLALIREHEQGRSNEARSDHAQEGAAESDLGELVDTATRAFATVAFVLLDANGALIDLRDRATTAA